MNKIEFIARELCKRDGISDPDWPAIDKRVAPAQNQMVRIVEAPTHSLVAPAWKFYAAEVELVLQLEATWEAEGAS